jgi:uncharacterized membrane protein YraQ (UPF0718 family)
MGKVSGNPKKKPIGKMILMGIISIAAYIAVFTNQEIVTKYCTEGGFYSALPIIAVFFFSFVHAPFASYVLSALGIEPKKKK